MGKNWFEDGDNWDCRDLDNACLECGDTIFRASRVQGVCAECLNGSFDALTGDREDDIDLGYDWSEEDEDVSD